MLAWEIDRARKVASVLGVSAAGEVGALRERLTARKLDLGHDAIEAQLARKLAAGVRHQFCDNPGGGFDAILTVEFPLAAAPHMIASHRWHLACEFNNWLETIND